MQCPKSYTSASCGKNSIQKGDAGLEAIKSEQLDGSIKRDVFGFGRTVGAVCFSEAVDI